MPTIIGALPFNILNGTLEDATQVMSNYNSIVSQVNSNAAASPINADITQMTQLASVTHNVSFSGGIDLANQAITGVGNIAGTNTGSAYTMGGNPVATITVGGYVQVWGSTSVNPGLVQLGNNIANAAGQIVFVTNGGTRLQIQNNGAFNFMPGVVSQSTFTFEGGDNVYMAWKNNSRAANNKNWLLILQSDASINLNAYDDALSSSGTAVQFKRSGTTPTGMVVGSGAWTPTKTVPAAATLNLDNSTTNIFRVTMGTNVTTLNMNNTGDGQSGSIWFLQDGTGSRTCAFPGNFKWPGGSAQVLSTAPNSRDRLDWTFDTASAIFDVALTKGIA